MRSRVKGLGSPNNFPVFARSWLLYRSLSFFRVPDTSPGALNWALVRRFSLSDHKNENLLSTIDPYYGNIW